MNGRKDEGCDEGVEGRDSLRRLDASGSGEIELTQGATLLESAGLHEMGNAKKIRCDADLYFLQRV